MTMEELTRALADAIAVAEGYYVSGSLAARANNPGNLKLGDVGYGMIDGKTVYATVTDGWNALYRQVRLMLTGESAYYHPGMTLSEVAVIYTGGDNPVSWAYTVAQSLGVSVQTRLSDLLAGAAEMIGETSITLPLPAGESFSVNPLLLGFSGLLLLLVILD